MQGGPKLGFFHSVKLGLRKQSTTGEGLSLWLRMSTSVERRLKCRLQPRSDLLSVRQIICTFFMSNQISLHIPLLEVVQNALETDENREKCLTACTVHGGCFSIIAQITSATFCLHKTHAGRFEILKKYSNDFPGSSQQKVDGHLIKRSSLQKRVRL